MILYFLRVILDEQMFLQGCALAEGIHKGASNSAPLWVPSAKAHLRKEFCSTGDDTVELAKFLLQKGKKNEST